MCVEAGFCQIRSHIIPETYSIPYTYTLFHHNRYTLKSNHCQSGLIVIIIPVGVQCNNSIDKPKQQLTFSQSDFPHSPVAMDTSDVTSGCIMLPPTPPAKKVSFIVYSCLY